MCVTGFVFASGVKENNRVWAQCALHLRKYNDALLIHDTLRMTDAFCLLGDFYCSKVNKEIDATDHFLMALFRGAYFLAFTQLSDGSVEKSHFCSMLGFHWSRIKMNYELKSTDFSVYLEHCVSCAMGVSPSSS